MYLRAFSFLFSRLCFISLLRIVVVVVAALVQAQFKVLKLGIWTLNVISLTSYKKNDRSENLNGKEISCPHAVHFMDVRSHFKTVHFGWAIEKWNHLLNSMLLNSWCRLTEPNCPRVLWCRRIKRKKKCTSTNIDRWPYKYQSKMHSQFHDPFYIRSIWIAAQHKTF